jgi:hypothetical protein
MARGQKKQKGGREKKISLDFTEKELKTLDNLRGDASRSDFIALMMAYWGETTISWLAQADFFGIHASSGMGYDFQRDKSGWKLVRKVDIENEP